MTEFLDFFQGIKIMKMQDKMQITVDHWMIILAWSGTVTGHL